MYREELRGISRGKNAKDVDWFKIAGAVEVEVIEKPAPAKIAVSEVLNRVRKPTKQIILKNQAAIDKNSKCFSVFCIITYF